MRDLRSRGVRWRYEKEAAAGPEGRRQGTAGARLEGRDRVMKQGMQGTYEITRVSPDGKEANLCLPGTNFELFRVRTDLLTPAKEVA